MAIDSGEPAVQESITCHLNVNVLSCDDEKQPSVIKSADFEQQPTADSEGYRHASKESAFKSLGLLDRFLALWIFLAMLIGILLGNFVDNIGPALQKGTFVGVSIPIGPCLKNALLSHQANSHPAVGLLVMMYPILCKVQFESLHHIFREREVWKQILFSIIFNWVIAPLVMVLPPLPPFTFTL